MNRTTFHIVRGRPFDICARRSKHSLGQLYTSSKFSIAAAAIAMATIDLSSYDAEQAKLMKERCILVNEKDESLGAVDKKDCKFVRS
jgi:hypothetical protein